MAKSSKTNTRSGSDFALLQGGILDQNVLQRQIAEIRKRSVAELEEQIAARQEADKAIAEMGTDREQAGEDARSSSTQGFQGTCDQSDQRYVWSGAA